MTTSDQERAAPAQQPVAWMYEYDGRILGIGRGEEALAIRRQAFPYATFTALVPASSIASLSKRVAEVERENGHWINENRRILKSGQDAAYKLSALEQENAELRAKLAEAREVIEPFARNAAAGDGTGPFEVPNGHAARFHDTDNPAKATLFEGDFRRARAFRDATSEGDAG